MHYYWPTEKDMLDSLPPAERIELLLALAAAPAAQRWVTVSPAVWDAFTEAVRRGDYDRR